MEKKIVFEQTTQKRIKKRKKINYKPFVIIPIILIVLVFLSRFIYCKVTGYDYFNKIDEILNTKLANIPTFIKEKEIEDGNIFYEQLDDESKKIYQAIYNGCIKKESKTIIRSKANEDTLAKALDALRAYYPEFYWLFYTYTYGENLYGNTIIEFNSSKSDMNNIDKLINSLKKESEYETALAIHDYIIDKVVYKLDCQYNQDYRSALYTENAVCAGYSALFQVLCKKCGLECYYITGEANVDGGFDGHAWNLVKIDGQFYWVDATWDDVENNRYNYFLIGDEILFETHRFDKDFIYPNCGNDLTYYEYGKNGDVVVSNLTAINIDEVFISLISSSDTITFRFVSNDDYQNVYHNWFNNNEINGLLKRANKRVSYRYYYSPHYICFELK